MHLNYLSGLAATAILLAPTISASAVLPVPPVPGKDIKCYIRPVQFGRAVKTYEKVQQIVRTCQTTGQPIKGNRVWYKTQDKCYVSEHSVGPYKGDRKIEKCKPIVTPRPPLPKPSPVQKNDDDPIDEKEELALEQVLEAISEVPDDADDEWFANLVPAEQPTTTTEGNGSLEKRQNWFQIGNCAFQIGRAIVENFTPAKVLKFKKIIDLLGGYREVAKKLRRAKSRREIFTILGPELRELGEAFLNSSSVIDACTNF